MKLDQIAHHPEAQVVTKFTHEALECIVPEGTIEEDAEIIDADSE